jgi:hypothetical protein
MKLSTLLNVLPVVGPALATAKEFVDLYREATAALDPADQDTAKAALADIQADNDEGHARLQEKLAEAAKH